MTNTVSRFQLWILAIFSLVKQNAKEAELAGKGFRRWLKLFHKGYVVNFTYILCLRDFCCLVLFSIGATGPKLKAISAYNCSVQSEQNLTFKETFASKMSKETVMRKLWILKHGARWQYYVIHRQGVLKRSRCLKLEGLSAFIRFKNFGTSIYLKQT